MSRHAYCPAQRFFQAGFIVGALGGLLVGVVIGWVIGLYGWMRWSGKGWWR